MYLEIFLADFAVFRGKTWISRVRDRAKYQNPWKYYLLANVLLGCPSLKKGHVYFTVQTKELQLKSKKSVNQN